MSRSAALGLYKTMMKEAGTIQDFNFRNYFQRRIRTEFENPANKDEAAAAAALAKCRISLDMIERQATIGKLYNQNITLPVK